MQKEEIIKLLDQNNNFHLTFKVISFEDKTLLKEYDDYLNNRLIDHLLLTDMDNCLKLIQNHYNNQQKYIITTTDFDFFLEQLIVLSVGNTKLIKPIIPVYYLSKDNKVIQKIKTRCHQINNNLFFGYKNKEQLFIDITNQITK